MKQKTSWKQKVPILAQNFQPFHAHLVGTLQLMISFALSPKREKNSTPQSEQNMNNIYNLACSACIAELKHQMYNYVTLLLLH